jgi:FkbM family methyltransferase
MKVFLDVGAHTGQTLAAAKCWDFDRIVCFEPVKQHLSKLTESADERTEIEMFGLWDRTALRTLFDPGSQGASLWKRPGRSEAAETCLFVSAAEWLLENTSPNDTVWMKLNAEGAELDIITDLLDSGVFDRINFLQVMWDAGKIPEIADRVAAVRARVEAKYRAPQVINSKALPPAKTHADRIDGWLALTSAKRLG